MGMPSMWLNTPPQQIEPVNTKLEEKITFLENKIEELKKNNYKYRGLLRKNKIEVDDSEDINPEEIKSEENSEENKQQ